MYVSSCLTLTHSHSSPPLSRCWNCLTNHGGTGSVLYYVYIYICLEMNLICVIVLNPDREGVSEAAQGVSLVRLCLLYVSVCRYVLYDVDFSCNEWVIDCCSSKKSGKGKRPGKGGNRFYKSVGLGFKTPREAIEGSVLFHSPFLLNCCFRMFNWGIWCRHCRKDSCIMCKFVYQMHLCVCWQVCSFRVFSCLIMHRYASNMNLDYCVFKLLLHILRFYGQLSELIV